MAGREVSRELRRDLLVAPDQVRAHGLVVLEGDEPVWSARLAERGQLPVPDRIRHLHGELMGELADSVLREPRVGRAPGVLLLLARDDPHPDAGLDERRTLLRLRRLRS